MSQKSQSDQSSSGRVAIRNLRFDFDNKLDAFLKEEDVASNKENKLQHSNRLLEKMRIIEKSLNCPSNIEPPKFEYQNEVPV